jgi:ABC-type sugar transport system ATPase subunit
VYPNHSTATELKVLLRAESISKRYGSTQALDNVDFDMYEGEVHALVGENGAGKSTLLKILSGMERPSKGAIHINGKTYDHLTIGSAQEKGMVMVPQHVMLVESMTVADSIFLGRWPQHKYIIDENTMYQSSKRILEAVGLDISPDTLTADLTYVQKQMVEIARVSEFFSPKLIILDEPTAALSIREIDILFGLIRRLRAKGVGIIYVSHFIPEIFQISDRVTVLRDGHVVFREKTSHVSIEQIIHHMVGDIADLYSRHQAKKAEVVLSVQHARTKSQLDISFEVSSGEIVGIAAPKGEGVSEFLRALCHISGKFSSGQVIYKGKPLNISNSSEALREGIGYLSEERHRWGILQNMSVRENITISSLNKFERLVSIINNRNEKKTALSLVKEFWIKTPSVESPIEDLSGGNQQKVLVARLFNANLSLYILDDPTFGVDVKSKAEINKLMNRAVETGAAVLLSSSDLTELLQMSDSLLLIKNGRIEAEFKRGEIDINQLIHYMGGIDAVK